VKEAIFYRTQRGDAPVMEFLDGLSKKMQAKVYRAVNLLEQYGENLHRPFVDHLRGPIKELRIRRASDDIRILFFFFHGKYVVLAHVLRKQTREVPVADIDKAEERMKDFLTRYQNGEIKL
jgi:phage-related protein